MEEANIAAAEPTAAVEYSRARAAFEDALMSGDHAAIDAARKQMDAAAHAYTALLSKAPDRRAMPPFEALLNDPTRQFDRTGSVLASVIAYAQAIPASASRPHERLVTSALSSGEHPAFATFETATLTAVG